MKRKKESPLHRLMSQYSHRDQLAAIERQLECDIGVLLSGMNKAQMTALVNKHLLIDVEDANFAIITRITKNKGKPVLVDEDDICIQIENVTLNDKLHLYDCIKEVLNEQKT